MSNLLKVLIGNLFTLEVVFIYLSDKNYAYLYL